jgi:MoaA/NifB/PqqE/SkfB family radical SAM enzyme
MKYIEDIKKIQLELSNFCNASCVGCRRTDHRTLTEKYEISSAPKVFLTLDLIRNLITDPVMKSVREVEFCGTIDEPLAHPDFLEILQILFDANPNLFIRIHTNGAVRNKEFYSKLARILTMFRSHEVRFSIDGLEESHRLYRGDLDYNKILENAKTFISVGGLAVWQMLQFPWNEHEVETCDAMAKEMNFKKFIFRRDRTHSSSFTVEYIKEKRLKNEPAPPKFNPVELNLVEDDSIILCHYKTEKMVFVNHEGKLFPCCFMSNMNITRLSEMSLQFNNNVTNVYGEDFNSLHHHSATEIMNHVWFADKLTASWNNKYADENAKLLVCSKSCGQTAPPKANHITVKDF